MTDGKKYLLNIIIIILLIQKNVLGFGFLRDLIFPRRPVLHRVRSFAGGRSSGDNNDPPIILDTVGLVEKYGYPCKEYDIKTEDGYKIKIHRIPNSPNLKRQYKNNEKPVIFLQHGFLASSDTWTLLGPGKDLAFLLADEGYDVWLGNIRGNTYGRSHEELSPDDSEFWKFSFHEMGIYDLPAMIDYALKESQQKKIYYIGHSMGSTMSYILLSTKLEYNEKIKLAISLAPIAFWKIPPTIPTTDVASSRFSELKAIFDNNQIHEVLPLTTNAIRLGRSFCRDGMITQPVCVALTFAISGRDEYQFNKTMLPVLLSHFPAGASTQTLYHYLQNINQSNFQMYDFGYVQNLKLYSNKKPPVYNIEKITAPFALIYAKNDALSKQENTLMLSKNLSNVVTVESVPFNYFNHLDFIWAREAKNLVYNRVISLLSKYQ